VVPEQHIQVILVGTQRVVLDSLRSLVDGEPDMRVLGEPCESGPMHANGGTAAVALFDLDDLDDAGTFERLEQTTRSTPTIVLSIATDSAVAYKVFQRGAMGLVSKRQAPAALLMAIRKVHAGEAWLGRALAAEVIALARADRLRRQQPAASAMPALTARDRQMIALVGEGWKNADIARHLVASEATVRAGLTTIFRKLGVSGRFALMMYASQHGYVKSPRPRRLGR
jgi:DNA-binding NarL/FixJ family response regulator